MQVNMIY